MAYTFLMVVLLVLIALRFIPKNQAAAARRIPMSLPEKAGMGIALIAIVVGYFGTKIGFGADAGITKNQSLQIMMGGIFIACAVRLFRRFMGRQAMVVSGRDNVYVDVVVIVITLALAIVPLSELGKLH